MDVINLPLLGFLEKLKIEKKKKKGNTPSIVACRPVAK
jgi:hypothetical protein